MDALRPVLRTQNLSDCSPTVTLPPRWPFASCRWANTSAQNTCRMDFAANNGREGRGRWRNHARRRRLARSRRTGTHRLRHRRSSSREESSAFAANQGGESRWRSHARRRRKPRSSSNNQVAKNHCHTISPSLIEVDLVPIQVDLAKPFVHHFIGQLLAGIHDDILHLRRRLGDVPGSHHVTISGRTPCRP